MVQAVLRNVNKDVPLRLVHASRGKVTRAEPVAALYEQSRVFHVGSFPELEDQMCAFTSDFDRNTSGYSPDRVDALVWAITELTNTFVVVDDSIGASSVSKSPRLLDREFYRSGTADVLSVCFPA